MIANIPRLFLSFISSFFVLTLFTFTLAQFFPAGLSFMESAPANIANNLSNVTLLDSYLDYLHNVLTGELGLSSARGTAVYEDFFMYFPATIELTICALLLASLFGLPLGIYAAKQKDSWQDKLITSSALVGYSIPIFWWAMLLVLFFSLTLGITPVASRLGFEYDIPYYTGFMLIDTLLADEPYSIEAFRNALHHLILPSIVLGTIPFAVIVRSTRTTMTEVLSSDYIRSAKARGISASKILWKYALRNAMIPMITTMSLQISILLAGSLITESVFSWPGIGKWLLEAVFRRDYAVIHGGILAIASFIIVLHLFLDLFQAYLDPKLRRNL